MSENGWEERGPKAHSMNSDLGTPMIEVLFSGLSKVCDLWLRALLVAHVGQKSQNVPTLTARLRSEKLQNESSPNFRISSRIFSRIFL